MRVLILVSFITAMLSWSAGCVGASPLPISQPQLAGSPAFDIAIFGMPFPHAAVAAPSLRRPTSGTDGAEPLAGLIDMNGVLYGTTTYGGQFGYGAIFATTTSGKEHVIYSFTGGVDGSSPQSSLIGVKGVLYGTTAGGGRNNGGTVFAVTTTGQESVLYSFGSKSGDGTKPAAGLVDVKGVLYGTTFQGGSGNGCGGSCGTVFAVTTSGKERVLYSFSGGADGGLPQSDLINVNGALYGATYVGGTGGCSSPVGDGCGTVFSITTSGQENVLYSFGGSPDAAYPVAGLIDVNGVLYGTTESGGGGSACGYLGCGTVFAVTAPGQENVLYSFAGGADGVQPNAGLTYLNGEFYGTTSYGGQINDGTFFAVTTTGQELVLHNFGGGTDGQAPYGSLVDVKGVLYGTTTLGGGAGNCPAGPSDCGTVFGITTSGQERIIHSFGG